MSFARGNELLIGSDCIELQFDFMFSDAANRVIQDSALFLDSNKREMKTA